MVRERAEGQVLWEGGCLVIIWVEFGKELRAEAKGIVERSVLGCRWSFRWISGVVSVVEWS